MNNEVKHSGRLSQMFIYTGKLFRMFVFQNDWKVFPMAAVITAIVCFVISKDMFVTMEGTTKGCFAIACICIWNGMFNSIQSVCRERPIVKREHRSGMHITSYICAHMIYQLVLCLGQAAVTTAVMKFSDVRFPETPLVTPLGITDIFLTLFLITFAADMLALLISSLVRNPTTAMTIVPFLLIFQLVFSGTMFAIGGNAAKLQDFTLSKWGITALCTQGSYNTLPMTTPWKTIKKLENVKVENATPIKDIIERVEKVGSEKAFQLRCGKENYHEEYESVRSNVIDCYIRIILQTLVFAALAVIALEFIDKDKR